MTSATQHALPLLAHADLDSRFAWLGSAPITRRDFLRDAIALANRLPQGRFAFNLCDDRYRFTVAFAASCLKSQTTLLPPSRAPAVIAQLRNEFLDHHIIDDKVVGAQTVGGHESIDVPPVPSEFLAAIVFTSGSTGAPQPNRKLWRTLVGVAHQEKRRLFVDGANIVATVPAQHMYGFETTTLLAMGSNCAIHDSKPLFPADIRAALEVVPAPRVLVTTPWHLQKCLQGGIEPPALQRVISATAPLDTDLARAIESKWQVEVHEIYGCSEAGSMASRRTVQSDLWHAYESGRFSQRQDASFYSGAHLPGEVPLQDHLELRDAEHVRLIGRATDIVKIGGKRASLTELTRQLNSIDGVLDGVMFQPESDQRMAALVVAPQMSSASLLAALSTRIDSTFMPRPLVIVDRLPRTDLGKLPQAALLSALSSAATVSGANDADVSGSAQP